MAQRTRHGRPSDKGQKGCAAIGLLLARYRRAKCLTIWRGFPPSRPSFRPGFSRRAGGVFHLFVCFRLILCPSWQCVGFSP
jgi:hypothetical protein